MRQGLIWGVLLPVAALAGCAGDYYYRPTEHATAQLASSGLPAALYQVPADRPQGEVKIASLGVRKTEGEIDRQLIVRLIVTNNSEQPWSVDLRQQTAIFPDGQQRAPNFVYGGMASSSPLVTIPPRQQGAFDILFPVPDETSTKTFQLAWSVTTSGGLASGRTSFRREAVPPSYAVAGPDSYYYGYGPYADFYYPPVGFYPYPFGFGSTVIIDRHPGDFYGRHARVGPPPPAVRVPPPASPSLRSVPPSPDMRVAPPAGRR